MQCVFRPTSPYTTWAPGSLELPSPVDVRLLVEAGLDLDEDDDLLALLGGPDEVVDDLRVERRPVERLLDREDVRVVGRLLDQPLDARREALVRVVDEDVARLDGREHVGRLVVIGRQEPRRDDRAQRLDLEIRPVEVDELPQARQVEHPADLVRLVLGEAEAAPQDLARRGRHRPLDLHADRIAEPSPAQLLLDRQEEVVGVLLLEREVRVPGHAEEVALDDLEAR